MASRQGTDINELKRQASAIRAKLVKLRAELDSQPLVEEYDNGGGQTGTHANPWVVEYQRLVKTYRGLVRDITEYEKSAGVNPKSSTSPLILMRGKYEGERKAE